MGGGEEGASTTAGVGGLGPGPSRPTWTPLRELGGQLQGGKRAERPGGRGTREVSAASTSATLRPERGGLPRPKRRPRAPTRARAAPGPSPLPGGPQPLVRRRGGGPPLSAGRTTAEGRRGAAAGRARGAACRQEGQARPHPPRPRQGGAGRALSTNPGPSPGQRGWARAAAAAGGSGGPRASVLKGSRPPVTWPDPARHFPPSAKKIIWNDRGREGAPLCFFSLFRKLEKQGSTARQVVSLALGAVQKERPSPILQVWKPRTLPGAGRSRRGDWEGGTQGLVWVLGSDP